MRILIFVVFLFGLCSTYSPAFAVEDIPHYAVIINQVRGTECCDAGTVAAFSEQQRELQNRNLAATFTIRYDALSNPDFVAAIKNYPEFEYGGLLEVTPSLAEAASVEYTGSAENWFEAQHVFLVGYSQEERAALIDAYMEQFKTVFGVYPKTTTAWMIDPFSLRYLRNEYGVTTHEITREQFGTDSYTLYGGPPHYPYWSGADWAVMPSESAVDSTLILRQTITDPVYNYGDQTSAFTSQPNDYRLRGATTEYFSHLFLQAHDQPASNGYTFAQLGIENSLAAENQQEFFQQLDVVENWQANSHGRVVTAGDFYSWMRTQPVQKMSVYEGVSQTDAAERAWWITTPKYRVRLRLSDGTLAITDLRIYDEQFPDPYLDDTARSMGWWIVPYILDGSRGSTTQVGQAARNDVLKDRPSSYPEAKLWEIASDLSPLSFEEITTSIIRFSPNSFELLQGGPQITLDWQTTVGLPAWGFAVSNNTYTPFSSPELLASERKSKKGQLFPEIQLGEIVVEQTTLFINNRYAVAGRNPARLVLFPNDSEGFPILLSEPPDISLSAAEATASSLPPHGSNGMIFIDIVAQKPMHVNALITAGAFSQDVDVYLAPNCAKAIRYCLFHPVEAYWYVRSVLDDKLRFLQQRKQFQEQLH
ncbi:MAG: hypothetical protein O2840_00265 [bacterium]|nr:hypothetical protein [bacterium]